MATVDVENIEEAGELFMEQMGFAHDSDGLSLTDDQLVNFLMLCYQIKYGIGDDDEEYEDVPPEMKVKIIKMHDGGDDMRSMMDQILGHGGPEIKDRY